MKSVLNILSSSWVGLITHKLRSILTILGVVIGVGAVIALMSMGKATEASIMSRLQNLGSNLLYVQPGTTSTDGVKNAVGSAATLTQEDSTAIIAQVSEISAAAAFATSQQQVVVGAKNSRAQVTGISPDYQNAINIKLEIGSLINQSQYDNNLNVAVIGSTVRNNLFGTDNAVGQTMRIGRILVRVVGVLAPQGESIRTALGSSDNAIFIPLSTFQESLQQTRTLSGEHQINGIVISLNDGTNTTDASGAIKNVLRDRHEILPGADDDFTVTSVEELATTITEASTRMTMLLTAIAGISLLVGGIGVMNIMLVSVMERKREIGVRKALGARERDIWSQFLIEAAVLTFTGGVIGVGAGWGASVLLSHLASTATLVSSDIVVLALAVSIAIGLFFGFYPAWQASRLDPIEALRAE
jgi:putative ABC transport system permease protein